MFSTLGFVLPPQCLPNTAARIAGIVIFRILLFAGNEALLLIIVITILYNKIFSKYYYHGKYIILKMKNAETD